MTSTDTTTFISPNKPLVSLVAPKSAFPPKHWADLTTAERSDAMREYLLPNFRAQQINNQYFKRFEADPLLMSDIPRGIAPKIAQKYFPELLTTVRILSADNGNTYKILWRLSDGSLLENVIMFYPDRVTLCISSQAGCGMACTFCATGRAGLQRNLSAGEIIEQFRLAAKFVAEKTSNKRQLNRVVFMGMGEPLANYCRVIKAVKTFINPDAGFGLSARSIVLSTVGIVPGIVKLAAEELPLTLAVSMHAPDNELRNTLVPINNRFDVEEVYRAMSDYAHKTKRRVSIEYALIKDINDQSWRGDLLGRRIKESLGQLGHVNVIPLNPTPGTDWDASDPRIMQEFVAAVRSHGISCTIRNTRGQSISAACGQLAADEKK